MRRHLDPADISALEAEAKIALVATAGAEGQPHLTLLTTLQGVSPGQLIVGEFCKGMSKQNLEKRKKAAFLVLSLDRFLWRGRAIWTHKRSEGPEYEILNRKPMFRYNSYFGINTVHYLDLVEVSRKQRLPLETIIPSAILTRAVRAVTPGRGADALSPWARKLFNGLGTLKFIASVGEGGFPSIVPVVQCQAAGSGRLVFSPTAYRSELQHIPAGACVAVYAMNTSMESILVRGRLATVGPARVPGPRLVDIDWVYNSMPPAHGPIYPQAPLVPVREFEA